MLWIKNKKLILNYVFLSAGLKHFEPRSQILLNKAFCMIWIQPVSLSVGIYDTLFLKVNNNMLTRKSMQNYQHAIVSTFFSIYNSL